MRNDKMKDDLSTVTVLSATACLLALYALAMKWLLWQIPTEAIFWIAKAAGLLWVFATIALWANVRSETT